MYLPDFLLDEMQQGFELVFDHKMVVFSISVLRNFGRSRVFLFGRVVIIVHQTDDRFGARHQLSRIYPFVEMVGHVVHLPVHALLEPLFQVAGFFIHKLGLGHTHLIKTQSLGLGTNHVGMGLSLVHALIIKA